MGETGSGVGEFRFGQGGGNDSGAGGGLAIADGYLFVADTRNDRIQRMALDGAGATVIVPTGAVKRPQGLAARSGRLIVADDNGHRMVVYDYNGAQLTTFGTGPGNKPGQLSFPYDVGIDALGRVFVADNINHRVVRYGPGPKYTYRAAGARTARGSGSCSTRAGSPSPATATSSSPTRAATGSTSSTSGARRRGSSAAPGA